MGISPGRLAELNRLLAADDLPGTPGQIGFQVVARLAARHGIHVGLAALAGGGTEATVVLPAAVLVESARPAAPTVTAPVVGMADAPLAPLAPLERELAAAGLDEAAALQDEPAPATDLEPGPDTEAEA